MPPKRITKSVKEEPLISVTEPISTITEPISTTTEPKKQNIKEIFNEDGEFLWGRYNQIKIDIVLATERGCCYLRWLLSQKYISEKDKNRIILSLASNI